MVVVGHGVRRIVCYIPFIYTFALVILVFQEIFSIISYFSLMCRDVNRFFFFSVLILSKSINK